MNNTNYNKRALYPIIISVMKEANKPLRCLEITNKLNEKLETDFTSEYVRDRLVCMKNIGMVKSGWIKDEPLFRVWWVK